MSTITSLYLRHIVADPEHNPRKGDLEGIEALAASIKANGLLQPIVVRLLPHPPETYQVVAGHRRFAALQLLDKDNPDAACPVIITTAENVHELALTENVMRQNMHPVDEFTAFAKLRTDGLSIKKIAERFGLKEKEVKQRLALGSIIPEIRELWREGNVTYRAATLLCQAPESKQRQILENANGRQIEEWMIRQALNNERIEPTDARVNFVGLAEYKAAGGKVDTNLFGDGSWLSDPDLLDQLAEEKKLGLLADAEAEGWKEVHWDGDDGEPDYQTHTILHKLDATTLEPEEKAEIVCVIDMEWDGKVSRTYWRAKEQKVQADGTPAPASSMDKPGASMMLDADMTKALSEDMSHVMTGFAHAYAQQEGNRHTVLAMLAFALTHAMSNFPLQVKGTVYTPTPSAKGLIAKAWAGTETPLLYSTGTPEQRIEWLLGAETDDVVNIIWQAAAKCFRFTDGYDAGKPEIRQAWYKQLVLNGDSVPEGWRPDADNYFKRLTKEKIIEAMEEMKPGSSRSSLLEKKSEFAIAAEKLARETGWLPRLLAPVLHGDETPASGVDDVVVDHSTVPLGTLPPVQYDGPLETEEDFRQARRMVGGISDNHPGIDAEAEMEDELAAEAERDEDEALEDEHGARAGFTMTATARTDDTLSISDRLKAIGLGHRPGPRSNRREIYNLTTGTVMGQYDALEAVEAFLTEGPTDEDMAAAGIPVVVHAEAKTKKRGGRKSVERRIAEIGQTLEAAE